MIDRYPHTVDLFDMEPIRRLCPVPSQLHRWARFRDGIRTDVSVELSAGLRDYFVCIEDLLLDSRQGNRVAFSVTPRGEITGLVFSKIEYVGETKVVSNDGVVIPGCTPSERRQATEQITHALKGLEDVEAVQNCGFFAPPPTGPI